MKNILFLSFLIFHSQVIGAETPLPSPTTKEVKTIVQAESRLALVIGNSDYRHEAKLANTVNDANDMAEILKTLGFEVLLKPNLGKREMVAVVQEFREKLPKYHVGLFYYSGYGLQADGVNYLVPVDAKIKSKAEIEFKSVDANRILTYMEQANQEVNILILDACRENPFQTNLKGVKKGLAEMKGTTGSLIAFATAPNKLSWGGEEGERNSVYTKHLLKALRTQAQLSVLDLLTEVVGRVKAETKGGQVPWIQGYLSEIFYFSPSLSIEDFKTVPGQELPTTVPTHKLSPAPPPKSFPVPSREKRSWKAHSGGKEEAICGKDCLAFTPDGQLLASGSWDDTIKLWQVSTGQLLKTLSEYGLGVCAVTFSPDGRLLASGSWDNTIKVWQVSTGLLVNTWSGHGASVCAVAFSPDGRLLVSGGDGIIKLWQVSKGQLFKTLSGPEKWVKSVIFSPDWRLLASDSDNNTVKLWQVSTGQLLNTLSGHEDSVSSLAFSPDGQLLASGSADKTVKLWQVRTGQLLNTLSDHKDSVNSVVFSPDGRLLASGSNDNTVKLWQVSTGQLLNTLLGHKNRVVSVAFSPDGRLASGDYDGVIKLWK
jgi:WD40 repeat protein